MGKMSLDDLRKLRERKRNEPGPGTGGEAAVCVIVAMGTSGIAAGARETLAAFVSELEEQGLTGVTVRQTGSLGLDHAEPTVEVRMPGMPPVIYGRVTPEVAVKIVRKHILGKALINDHVFDHPAVDIVQGKEKA